MSDTISDLEKLRDLVEGVEYCMLTTVDHDGSLHSRPMATQELDMTRQALWFFTAAPSPKTREISQQSQVNVAYAVPAKSLYISVAGEAETVRDRAKMKELWEEAHRAFFPEGLEDPNLALIKVTIQSAEYWQSPNKVVRAFNFAKAILTGTEYNAGENKKLSFV